MENNIKQLKSIADEMSSLFDLYQLLFEAVKNANELIVITNNDISNPEILYANSIFLKMTGYSEEEIIGNTPKILQGPKTDRKVIQRLKEELSNNNNFFGRAINYKKDGTEYVVEWHISPIFDKDNKVKNFVSIQRCLSDLPLATKEELDQLIRMGDSDSLEFSKKY